MRLRCKYVLVYSKIDKASLNIRDRILEVERSFKQVRDNLYYSDELKSYIAGFDDDIIYINYLDNMFEAETYIYLSRHSSAQRIKSLTAHFTGNVTNEYVYGANPRELSYTNPHLMKVLMLKLRRFHEEYKLVDSYDLTMEVTHHGPTNMKTPLIFVEIGSDEEAWTSKVAGEVIAHSVLESIKDILVHQDGTFECKVCLGFGGGHYARKHTKLELNSEVCYSHIFSKHQVGMVDNYILQQAIQKTHGTCRLAIIEKKSVPSEVRRTLTSTLESLGLEVKYI